ncbi:hypothetical protein FN976_12020 [Caenimonas sedimenti]|uniref:Uncharacterized protein n=1 Tax=Caenimonas sedimenti TaxID=2596921 RepID=A0A562ZR26_9BURK|nr:hypothetical protein [Caenimonas sedimenti]TWO71042.1 hypothetical protein FN976_12020 [Caenimonas sedimenti]
MVLRFVPPVLALVLTAGCVTVPPAPNYTPPTGGPSARLLVRTLHPGQGTVSISTFEQPVACSRRQLLERTTAAEPARSEFTLRANRLQSLSFVYMRNDRRACEVIVSFQPKANGRYLMRNRAGGDGCSVELIDATNPDQPADEPSTLRRERVGLAATDNACRPLTSVTPARSRTDGLPEVFREIFSP